MASKISQKPRQSNFFNVCRKCPTGCCSGARPPLTFKRKKIIQNFLEANGIKTPTPFEDRVYAFPRETKDGYCIFLDKTAKKCRIHPAKPETCVAGPITFDINLQTRKVEWFIKMEKICPLAGGLYQYKEAYEQHMKSAKREILRLVRDLNTEALRAILNIEEPDTFKVDEDNLDSKITAKLKL